MDVIFATKNPAKVKKYKEELEKNGINLLTINDLDIDIEIMDRGEESDEYFYLPPKILHLDGDKDYLDKCLKFYKKKKVTNCPDMGWSERHVSGIIPSFGATRNDVIDVMVKYGAITAGMLDGGSSSLMYYEDYYNKYDYDVDSLDQYQLMGLVNKYKAFTTPRRMPTYICVAREETTTPSESWGLLYEI